MDWNMASEVRHVLEQGLEKRGEELDVGRMRKM